MPTSVTGEFGIDKVTGANVVPYDNSGNGLPNTVQGAIDKSLINQSSDVLLGASNHVLLSELPPKVKEVTVVFLDVSTTHAVSPYFQLSTEGVFKTSSYVGISYSLSGVSPVQKNIATLSGAIIIYGANADNLYTGVLTLHKLATDYWMFNLNFSDRQNFLVGGAEGFINLLTPLDGIRISADTGSFDSGRVSVNWRF